MSHILFFGEPLIRISPLSLTHFSDSCSSQLYFGGSEVNIARSLQAFGCSTKLATALPANNMGDSFLQFLQQNRINTEHIQRVGNRIGIYFLENGIGCRQGEVIYDRTHSSLHEFKMENVDFEHLFQDVSHFHFSGITLALSQTIRKHLRVLLEEAKKRQIPISFDLNFRSRLISPDEAKKVFSDFASYADYCFGIEPLMIDATDTNFFDRDNATSETIRHRMQALLKTYDFKAIFHTYRANDEWGRNIYQAYLATSNGNFTVSPHLKTAVLQRVGSGDAFVAGALYQLTECAEPQTIIDFAVASATLKCTLEGDNMFESVHHVNQVLHQTKDIIR